MMHPKSFPWNVLQFSEDKKWHLKQIVGNHGMQTSNELVDEFDCTTTTVQTLITLSNNIHCSTISITGQTGEPSPRNSWLQLDLETDLDVAGIHPEKLLSASYSGKL
jgi:hypothetical protein